jgi:DNA processing protein
VAAPDDFEAWFRLLESPGLGRGAVRRLLATFGSPEAALSAGTAALRSAGVATVGPEPEGWRDRLTAARRWLDAGSDRHVLTLGMPGFPPALLQTADPPLMLYVQGSVPALSERSLAIVGSRQATAQGLDNARAFARALADEGLVIVSGLALGIDAAAHEGALDGRAGTVAVLGTGLDPVYPPRHAGLAARVAAHGALVSEFAPGTPPLRQHFPMRNRIIAGLGLGTLVVEAAPQSGSLITARLAAEAGREVFAIPGSIHSPQARGCHALIKQGAKLVESAADVLDELRGTRSLALATPAPEADDDPGPRAEEPLLEALGHEPTSLDALQARTGWPTSELNSRLLELELEGLVARLPGGLFQRRRAG